MFKPSAINFTDGYKTDHISQYPEGLYSIQSNMTPRKSRIPGINEVVVAGAAYVMRDFVIDFYKDTFFDQPKAVVVAAYKRRLDNYLGPNNITYAHVEALHDKQYLPIIVKSLPEGDLTPIGVPHMTFTEESPEFAWLPNFLETELSAEWWPLPTAATLAFNYRLIFDKWALLTVGNTSFSSTFQMHDFSARGLMGRYAAVKTGMAHLFCSRGTDTIWAIDALEYYYKANSDTELVGASVPATEHSVMCMGTKESEIETFRRLINVIYAVGIVSIVSDTWDLWKVLTEYLPILKEEILARDGKVVIRPDSGDPVDILCGLRIETDGRSPFFGKYYKSGPATSKIFQHENEDGTMRFSEAECKGVVQLLWEVFGGITNDKGFKELDPHIGCIYGDSITLERAEAICQRLHDKGFASTNWVAGIGSYTYQYVTRDTFGFAMKSTYGEIAHKASQIRTEADGSIVAIIDDGYDGGQYELVGADESGEIYEVQTMDMIEPLIIIEEREIFKDPITDDGTKKSAKGRLAVYKDDKGEYFLKDQCTADEEAGGELKVIYANGELVDAPSLVEIRERIEVNLLKRLS